MKLKEYLTQCDIHLKRINYAYNKMKDFMPLNYANYELLGDEEIEHIDQLIFRYSKLQDTIGAKLFPKILKLLGEDIKPMSFIDRLNRLEELGFVNKDEWMYLREIRNSVAHEYFTNVYLIVDSINELYNSVDKIKDIYENIKNKLKEKFENNTF